MENLVEHEFSGPTLFPTTDEFNIGIDITDIKRDSATLKININDTKSIDCKVKEGATVDIISSLGKTEVAISQIKDGLITFQVPQGQIFAPREYSLMIDDTLNLSNEK